MVDVGQFLGLRAAKRGSPSAAAQAGILDDSELVPQPAVRFSAGQIAVLFVALAAIASIPILLYPWPPLSDYINHLARMHVIAAVGSDPDLALFYQIEWQAIPNLMMDLVVPILERVMNVYLAGQVYTIMSFVLILSGTLALNRQLYRHWSVLPLIAFPLLYNNVFLVGTMNYLFGSCSSVIYSPSESTDSACSHSSCSGCCRCDAKRRPWMGPSSGASRHGLISSRAEFRFSRWCRSC